LLWYVLHGLSRAGIARCVVVVGYRHEQIEARLPSLTPRGMEITTVYNALWERPNGLSVQSAEHFMSGCTRFVLHMSDHLVDPRAVHHVVEVGRAPSLLVDSSPGQECDLVDATRVWVEEGFVARIGKHLEPFNAIDTGVFMLDHSVFPTLEEAAHGGDESLTGGMRILASQGRLGAVLLPSGARWHDVDTAEDMVSAERILAQGWSYAWATASMASDPPQGGLHGFP
jgi:choline kinase